MEWISAIIYIIGILATHYIIYHDRKENNIEHQTANIACLLWPVAMLLYFMLFVEDLFSNRINIE